jgi:hypothetical protein
MKYHKTERDYQVIEWHAAVKVWRSTPEQLTDEHLAALESFEGTKRADEAAAARQNALHPPQPAPVPIPPPTFELVLEKATHEIEAAFRRDPDPAFDRSKFTAAVRAERAQSALIVPGQYDPVAFLVARKQFKEHPAGLTDSDIEQLKCVDKDLGNQAMAARAGYAKKSEIATAADGWARTPISLQALFAVVDQVKDGLHSWIATLQRLTRETAKRVDLIEERLVDSKDAGTALPQALAQIKALTARVNYLEARPAMEYQGVLEAGKTYKPGHVVTWKGHMWVCRVETSAAPVFGDVATIGPRPWTLAVKAGRDGKDAPSLSR